MDIEKFAPTPWGGVYESFRDVDCTPPYNDTDIQETAFPRSFVLYLHAQDQADPSNYCNDPSLLGS